MQAHYRRRLWVGLIIGSRPLPNRTPMQSRRANWMKSAPAPVSKSKAADPLVLPQGGDTNRVVARSATNHKERFPADASLQPIPSIRKLSLTELLNGVPVRSPSAKCAEPRHIISIAIPIPSDLRPIRKSSFSFMLKNHRTAIEVTIECVADVFTSPRFEI